MTRRDCHYQVSGDGACVRYAIGAVEHYKNGEFYCADLRVEEHSGGNWLKAEDVDKRIQRLEIDRDSWRRCADQRESENIALRQQMESLKSCGVHGDPLVCLSCEAEEDARPTWRALGHTHYFDEVLGPCYFRCRCGARLWTPDAALSTPSQTETTKKE